MHLSARLWETVLGGLLAWVAASVLPPVDEAERVQPV
jgi:hypothetical protein